MECPVCHKEVATSGAEPPAFCNHCGARLLAATPAPAPTPLADSAFAAPPAVAASSGLSPNAASAVAYITFIPALVFLLIEPYNKIPLVRFHSLQSIGLNVVAIAIYVILRIVMAPFGFIFYSMVHTLVTLALFVIWLIVVLKASKGEWYKLPIIGDFALKQVQS